MQYLSSLADACMYNTILSATGTTLYSTSLELTHLFNYSFLTPGHYFLLPTLALIAGK